MNSHLLSKRLRRLGKQRGTATVEMAVMMIVLIPTILYTMYLEDLLFFKFDLEETVTSTPWDFSTHDYRKNSADDITGTVRQAAMQTYWDHTSAWNSYEDPNYDAKETIHHQDMAAHECWLAQGGQEVQCSVSKMVGMEIEGRFIMMNHGGLASCDAILGVQNYFLPNKFFEWWGKVGVTGDGNQKMKRHTAGQSEIHNEARNDPYLYPKMTFGVVHDTWALYKTDDIDPTMHPMEVLTDFGKWTNILYAMHANSKITEANKFADDAAQKQILSNQVKIDGIGDTLLTAPVAFKNDPQREVNGHYTSAWSDTRHQQTQQTQENKYMGVAETTW